MLGIDPRNEDEFQSHDPQGFRNSEEVRTVSSTGGEKGVKPQRFDLIPIGALTHLAEHYGAGAKKYADNQWRKGYEWSKSYAAIQRHLTAFWNGEDIDEETGSHHLDAVAWHAFTLRTFVEEHPGFDDRYSTTVKNGWDEEQARIMARNREVIERARLEYAGRNFHSRTFEFVGEAGPDGKQEPSRFETEEPEPHRELELFHVKSNVESMTVFAVKDEFGYVTFGTSFANLVENYKATRRYSGSLIMHPKDDKSRKMLEEQT